eukprot:s966_g10.t2
MEELSHTSFREEGGKWQSRPKCDDGAPEDTKDDLSPVEVEEAEEPPPPPPPLPPPAEEEKPGLLKRILWGGKAEDRWEQPATALASMGVNASDEEEALRQRRVEEEQSVSKALDRFSSMASAENRRWVTGSNELLQMYFAARQQELDVVRRCFTDAESKAKFTAAVTDRTDSHLGPLKKLPSSPQPQEPDLDLASTRQAWAKEVSQGIVASLRQDWRSGQKQTLQALSKDMRSAIRNMTAVLKTHLATQQKMSESAASAWSGQITKVQQRLTQVVRACRLAFEAMLQAELKEVSRFSARQKEFFERELQQAQQADSEDSQARAAQIKKLKLALAKWQKQYMSDALQRAKEAQAIKVETETKESVTGEGIALALEKGREWLDVQLPTLQEQAHEEAEAALEGFSDEEKAEHLPAVQQEILDRLLSEAATDRLEACGIVLEHLWEHSTSQEDTWNFIYGLEEEVPCTAAAVSLYEEHLAKHGIFAALGGPLVTSSALEEAEAAANLASTKQTAAKRQSSAAATKLAQRGKAKEPAAPPAPPAPVPAPTVVVPKAAPAAAGYPSDPPGSGAPARAPKAAAKPGVVWVDVNPKAWQKTTLNGHTGLSFQGFDGTQETRPWLSYVQQRAASDERVAVLILNRRHKSDAVAIKQFCASKHVPPPQFIVCGKGAPEEVCREWGMQDIHVTKDWDEATRIALSEVRTPGPLPLPRDPRHRAATDM